MPASYVVSMAVAVVVVVAARILLPVPTRATGAGSPSALLVLLGGLGLTFHCGAMFYRATVVAVPGTSALADAINRMGTASIVAFAVPSVILLAGLRRARPVLLALVVAGLTAVGVTMYNGSSLHTHLTTIVAAVALIALTSTDLFMTRRRGGGARVGRPVTATTS